MVTIPAKKVVSARWKVAFDLFLIENSPNFNKELSNEGIELWRFVQDELLG